MCSVAGYAGLWFSTYALSSKWGPHFSGVASQLGTYLESSVGHAPYSWTSCFWVVKYLRDNSLIKAHSALEDPLLGCGWSVPSCALQCCWEGPMAEEGQGEQQLWPQLGLKSRDVTLTPLPAEIFRKSSFYWSLGGNDKDWIVKAEREIILPPRSCKIIFKVKIMRTSLVVQ